MGQEQVSSSLKLRTRAEGHESPELPLARPGPTARVDKVDPQPPRVAPAKRKASKLSG